MCIFRSVGQGTVLCWIFWLSTVEDTGWDIPRKLGRALLISPLVAASGRKTATMERRCWWDTTTVGSGKPTGHIRGRPMTKSTVTAVTTSVASKLSPSCVACIERDSVQLGDDLVEGTMGGLLVGFNGCQLLHITMVSGGRSGSCQLSLVRQSSNLVLRPFHY